MRNTHMSQWIPSSSIQKSAGTWTPTLSTDLVCDVRTAAAAAFLLFIHIPLPSNSEYAAGVKLKSIDVYWKNATADMTNVTNVLLKKMTLAANAAAVTGAAVTIALDSSNDTDAKRITQASHTMTVTLSTAAYIDHDEEYVLYISAEGASGSVFTLFGARANYELKLE